MALLITIQERLFLISLMHVYTPDVCMCNGEVLDTQGGRGGVEGKECFSGN